MEGHYVHSGTDIRSYFRSAVPSDVLRGRQRTAERYHECTRKGVSAVAEIQVDRLVRTAAAVCMALTGVNILYYVAGLKAIDTSSV